MAIDKCSRERTFFQQLWFHVKRRGYFWRMFVRYFIYGLRLSSNSLTDKNLIKQLRSAQSADEIWQIFECADHSEESEDDTNLDNIEPQEV